jgi:DNA-binding CsgD family transcriptional regulator
VESVTPDDRRYPFLPDAPDGLELDFIELDGASFAVLSHSIRHPPPKALTRAEREVVEHVVAGRSNAQIAARRGTSVRTVANQLAAIFRKLAVGSRRELCVAIARHRAVTKDDQ